MPRSVASGRTAATNRVKVSDTKSSLSFNGTSSKVALTQTAGLPLYSSNTAYTILAWVKPSNNLGAQANTIYADGSTAGTSPVMWFSISNSNSRISLTIRNDATTTLKSLEGASTLPRNQWVKVALTDNNGTVKLYVDGVEDATSVAGTFNYTRTGTFTMNTATWGARTTNTTSFYLNGSLSNGRLYKTALTLDQINQAFNGGEPDAANRVGKYEFQEGAGTTAYDSSGNNNHGTITNGTFTSDVPTKKRGVVGGNLVYNGDFEYAPPFVAATTTTNTWIDGMAAGSTTNNLFGWGYQVNSGTGSAVFDTATLYNNKPMLKITSAAGASLFSSVARNNSAANVKLYGIPVLPNTSYTFTVVIKTNVLLGAADRGAYARAEEFNGAGSSVASNDTTFVKTTTDATVYTKVFTTSATTRYVAPQCYNRCSDGTGTLALEAWFADITLTPTVNTTRTAV